MFYKNLLVLVTGGAGFIGSHLTEQLVNMGANVKMLDNLSTGKLENIKPFADKLTFIKGSITDYQTCLEATKEVDIIFHLAADISVPGSMKNPRACYETNVMGTENILEAARQNNVKRVVFSSSCAVYGQQAGILSEECSCNPTSPYGLSKLIGEQLCQSYNNTFDLETVCLRYFNVFGERQDPNGAYAAVIAKFKDSMKQNKPLTIFGDGLQTRDFVPVATIVEANLTLGMISAQTVSGQIFNIATGKSINLLELIEQLKKEFPNWKAGITFAPARDGDIKNVIADNSKYIQLIRKSNVTIPKNNVHLRNP